MFVTLIVLLLSYFNSLVMGHGIRGVTSHLFKLHLRHLWELFGNDILMAQTTNFSIKIVKPIKLEGKLKIRLETRILGHKSQEENR